tara:strand:+ start:73 stop:306 length:234 start_codon:yes stop_codon:yes gene_type:complete
MKHLILLMTLLTMLNACSLPLVGSLTSNGITGAATGNYNKSLGHSVLDMAVHHKTGHTTTEMLIKEFKKQKEPQGSS